MTSGLADRESVRGRQGGLWEYVSASRLNLWLKCPLAFKFKYIDGIRLPTTPSLFLGKAVHAGLEVYYRHRQHGITLAAADVVAKMLKLWGPMMDAEDMRFETPDQEPALKRQAADLVTAYLAHVPGLETPVAVEAVMEAPLIDPATGEDLGVPLLGVIDLVLDEEPGSLVCDFKTSSRSSEPLEITHETQLTSYAYLFRHESPADEAGIEIRSLIKTKSAKIEFHRYPPRREDHFRRLFAVLHEYLDSLDAGRFNYRPGFGCSMCDFRERECGWWQES